jgi:hypothetical protein
MQETGSASNQRWRSETSAYPGGLAGLPVAVRICPVCCFRLDGFPAAKANLPRRAPNSCTQAIDAIMQRVKTRMFEGTLGTLLTAPGISGGEPEIFMFCQLAQRRPVAVMKSMLVLAPGAFPAEVPPQLENQEIPGPFSNCIRCVWACIGCATDFHRLRASREDIYLFSYTGSCSRKSLWNAVPEVAGHPCL